MAWACARWARSGAPSAAPTTSPSSATTTPAPSCGSSTEARASVEVADEPALIPHAIDGAVEALHLVLDAHRAGVSAGPSGAFPADARRGRRGGRRGEGSLAVGTRPPPELLRVAT